MHCCIGKATVIDDIHADPNINLAEDPLMVLGILPSMVNEESIEEIIFLESWVLIHLNSMLTVDTQSGFLGLTATIKDRTDAVLSIFEIDLEIDNAVVADRQTIDIPEIITLVGLYFLANDDGGCCIPWVHDFDPSRVLL